MIKECTAYEELFAAWLDGKLTIPEKLLLQKHVEECSCCHKEILAMKRHWDAVTLLTNVPPVTYPTKVKNFSSGFMQFLRSIRKTIWPPS